MSTTNHDFDIEAVPETATAVVPTQSCPTRTRVFIVMLFIVLACLGLFIAMYFLPIPRGGNPASAVPLSTTATYINPIILRTYCTGGSWVGYVGVEYNTTYGYVEYYMFNVCAGTLQALNTTLNQYLPGTTTTVWYFPDQLPRTYAYNPYVAAVPAKVDPTSFAIFLAGMGVVALTILIVIGNLILVKCFKLPPTGCCDTKCRK
jgi:hypothetical protein